MTEWMTAKQEVLYKWEFIVCNNNNNNDKKNSHINNIESLTLVFFVNNSHIIHKYDYLISDLFRCLNLIHWPRISEVMWRSKSRYKPSIKTLIACNHLINVLRVICDSELCKYLLFFRTKNVHKAKQNIKIVIAFF